MKLTLAEPKYLKESISIISEIVTEARFKITKDAVELVAMDPANVAMVIFKLFSSAFIEYDVKKEVDISINLGNLKQILRRINPNDMLNLEIEANKLKVQLRGDNIRTFNLPLIDIDDKEQKVPELNFPVKVELPSSMFNDAVEDADIVAESISFIAENGKFTIEASGDLSQVKTEVCESENVKIGFEGEGNIKAKYSVEYLKKMISGSKLSDRVIINFNKDYPLKLDYKSIDKVLLSFILAPRVEND